MDEIDKKILKFLQEDAKTTVKELSGKLNLSSTPIYERVKRLEREGVIKSYHAKLDRNKIGLSLMVFCTVSLNQHVAEAILKFEKEVQNLEEVNACYHIAGMFDYLLEIYVHDMAEYQNFVASKLASLDNIGKVQSSFVLTEIKEGGKYVVRD